MMLDFSSQMRDFSDIEGQEIANLGAHVSFPLHIALVTNLLRKDKTFLDYGARQVEDVKTLVQLGYQAVCWRSDRTPSTVPDPADVVQLSECLDTITCPNTRREMLLHAWQLTRQVLLVFTQMRFHDPGDHFSTRKNFTFSPDRHFSGATNGREIQHYLEETLQAQVCPVSLGVYFVFRDPSLAQTFCFQGICSAHRLLKPEVYENAIALSRLGEISPLLLPLAAFVCDRGRLPVATELPQSEEIIGEFGTFADAFEIISAESDRTAWEAIAHKQRNHLLVFLALLDLDLNNYTFNISQNWDFSSPNKTKNFQNNQDKKTHFFQALPFAIQQDIAGLFGSQQEAIEAILELQTAIQKPDTMINRCLQSDIGKKLPTALYVHTSALEKLDPLLQLWAAYASRHTIGWFNQATLIKFQLDRPQISYLFYPDFDADPHPALSASIQVEIPTLTLQYRHYVNSENPPILHRKETFVASDYPGYEKFANLTRAEETLKLLANPRYIGTRQGWEQYLHKHGVEIQDHRVVRLEKANAEGELPRIERHKAAMVRKELSRPVRLALEANLFTEGTTFFDYGCGYGGDIHRIAERGYSSSGWDPYYFPDQPRVSAEIVNIGYVINAIESLEERRNALVEAWELTQRLLIVSAQVLIEDRNNNAQVAYGDGVITRRNTFQKYYEQEELKRYIDQVLNVDAIPVNLGIYFVFRDEVQGQSFRASRFRSRTTIPRIHARSKRFEDYQELLSPVMAFVTERGRLPVAGELPQEAEILAEFGHYRRAFQVILQVTDQAEWDAIADKRRQDLLVYLGLTHFSIRPKFSEFSFLVQNDIKGLFGNYRQACTLADIMLFSIGDLNAIAKSCENSLIGQKLPNAFLVHISALDNLEPMLRLYEGCANRTIGRLDGATLIKFHTKTPKISYLFYPDFDTESHPLLQTSMQINLRDLRVSYRNFRNHPNPPILHQKDQLVLPDYPQYDKFAKLSRQEEDWGLLDDKNAIATRQGWLKCLEEHCAEIQGYRVFWRKDADPYRVKLVRSARRARQEKKRVHHVDNSSKTRE